MQAIAEALLEGNCFSSNVATRIVAETSGDFGVIEGCERDDFSFGDAVGATDGSTAEGVRSPAAQRACACHMLLCLLIIWLCDDLLMMLLLRLYVALVLAQCRCADSLHLCVLPPLQPSPCSSHHAQCCTFYAVM